MQCCEEKRQIEPWKSNQIGSGGKERKDKLEVEQVYERNSVFELAVASVVHTSSSTLPCFFVSKEKKLKENQS